MFKTIGEMDEFLEKHWNKNDTRRLSNGHNIVSILGLESLI
jgi:hypothetical protein